MSFPIVWNRQILWTTSNGRTRSLTLCVATNSFPSSEIKTRNPTFIQGAWPFEMLSALEGRRQICMAKTTNKKSNIFAPVLAAAGARAKTAANKQQLSSSWCSNTWQLGRSVLTGGRETEFAKNISGFQSSHWSRRQAVARRDFQCRNFSDFALEGVIQSNRINFRTPLLT
jgi:hypothetical protein